MSEFFLELFSEEVPALLQKNSRKSLLNAFQKLFEEKEITYKKSASYSTPNRLIIIFEGLNKEIIKKAEIIKGPNINAPEQALEGFLRSNQITKDQIFKNKNEKGEFYFFKTPSKKINTQDLLEEHIPELLGKIQWKKSMRWGNFELNWARPLKSILASFDNKNLNFKFHHLTSSNMTFIDKEFEEKKKIFKNFKTYKNFFLKSKVIVDHNQRRKIIEKEFIKISKRKNIIIESNDKLLEEVVNLTDKPNILICKFEERFLEIPEEILIITMQHHQKYFPTFNSKGNINNEFIVVANNEDINGLIKVGNERVVNARLSDAEFFWSKNKSQNLVKQVSNLRSMNFFKGLGSYFSKVQRMRKLGAMLSDELLIKKDKVELSASICKVDLISDLVGEFPELQGIMGGHFAKAQGFDKDISIAITEHYLPIGLESKIPKKPYSIALSLADKIDTLVGFFGINQKPTSSKDPYALRRMALGVIRILIENNKEFKIKDLISYSSNLYKDQELELLNESLQKDLTNFLMDRLRFYMKEKNIRYDIIQASFTSHNIDNIVSIFKKAASLNKVINNQIGQDIVSTYKRALNILESETENKNFEIGNTTDPGIFKTEYEKNLFKNINELRKYFGNINKDEKHEKTLINLAELKKVTFEFFDNVKVNDEDQNIKKNRLELLQLLCKTFENYIKFSIIESN